MKTWIALALVGAVTACGSSDDATETAGRTVVVEVGASTGMRLITDDGEDTGSESDVKQQDIKQCGEVFTGNVESWKVAGSENQVNIEPTDAFAVKITGNQNVLNLVIKAKAGEAAPVAFPGVCLVLGGNQPKVQATLTDVTLEHFKVIGHGNDGRIDVKLQGAAALPEGAADDLGKHVTVSVTDETP